MCSLPAQGPATKKSRNSIEETSDRPLLCSVSTWSVTVNEKELNYGQVHEMMHRDIAIGNDYRKERIKLLTTLATGVFALTVTFHKDMFGETLTRIGIWLIMLGWAALIFSLLAGIVHFRKWEDFYLEHRARANALWRYRTAPDEKEKKDAVIEFNQSETKIENFQKSYKNWNHIQSGGLIVGLVLIAAYVVTAGFSMTSEQSKTSPAPATNGQVTPANGQVTPAKKE
jgi:hypothetical protein